MDYWFSLGALITRPKRKSDRAVYEFIGSDGSMGLRRGQVMPLSVYVGNGRLLACWGCGCCPYDTVEAFSRNWRLCNVPY